MVKYLDEDGLGYFWEKIDVKKQNLLVSGESIKTVNGESVLGSGNLYIEGGSDPQKITNTQIDALFA